MKKSITLIAMLLLLAVSFVSCGKADEPEAKVPFTIVSTNPAQGVTGVPLNTVVKFVFSKKIAFDAKCFFYGGTSIPPLSVSYDNDKTVSIALNKTGFSMGGGVCLEVVGLKSADGEELIVEEEFGVGSTYWLKFN